MGCRLALGLLLLALAACARTSDDTGSDRPPPAPPPDPVIERRQPFPVPDTQGKTYVSIPGSGISLIRPDGFEDATRYPGFRQPVTGASVVVLAQPFGFASACNGFSSERARASGLTVLGTRHGTVDGHPALLAEIRQEIGGHRLHKWTLVLGNDTKAVMLNASVPADHAPTLSAVLKDVLLAARWDPEARPDPFASLGFTLQVEGFQIAHRLGNMLLFTLDGKMEFRPDGKMPPESPSRATFMAGRSVNEAAFLSQSWFARRRLRELSQYRDLKILAERELEIDDLEAVEILAEATDQKWGDRVFLYQVIVFEEDDNYDVLLGVAELREREKYEPMFRAAAASFRRI